MRPQDITSAFKAFIAAKSQATVSEEEFLRRLEICKQCPQNRRNVRRLRTRVSEILATFSNRFGVREEITKHSCGVCGCAFGLLLPAREENLHVDTPEQDKLRPDYCWMKKEKKK